MRMSTVFSVAFDVLFLPACVASTLLWHGATLFQAVFASFMINLVMGLIAFVLINGLLTLARRRRVFSVCFYSPIHTLLFVLVVMFPLLAEAALPARRSQRRYRVGATEA